MVMDRCVYLATELNFKKDLKEKAKSIRSFQLAIEREMIKRIENYRIVGNNDYIALSIEDWERIKVDIELAWQRYEEEGYEVLIRK